MVDKENQWENIEYSEDMDSSQEFESNDDTFDQDEYSDSQISDGDESDDYDYSDDGDEAYEQPAKTGGKNSSLLVLVVLILLLLLLGVGVFFLLPKNDSGKNIAKNPPAVEQNKTDNTMFPEDGGLDVTPAADNNQGQNPSPNEGDMFFDNNGNDNDLMTVDFNNDTGEANVTTPGDNGVVATVSNQPANENTNVTNDDLFNQAESLDLTPTEANNDIMISYNKQARSNPFKPPVIAPKKEETYATVNNTDFEIIEPPTTSIEDENLTNLLKTQISGIMFDEESPSAIVNLNGKDQFVKIGDTVSGYTIENITQDKVQIRYKNNSYVASVGQLFTRGVLEKQRAVANLESKFAGRYKNN